MAMIWPTLIPSSEAWENNNQIIRRLNLISTTNKKMG